LISLSSCTIRSDMQQRYYSSLLHLIHMDLLYQNLTSLAICKTQRLCGIFQNKCIKIERKVSILAISDEELYLIVWAVLISFDLRHGDRLAGFYDLHYYVSCIALLVQIDNEWF
jgi:hypothetical protein